MKSREKYLAIHGHFYQPPRENPWLESIEYQDSAAPFHDWNERISTECYYPNSCSRIVDSNNKIINIVNNYSKMSFNYGPTLLSWLEKHDPTTYEKIIKADRKSMETCSGHGNAIAQVYNHIIMPLANENDKYTQVIWGIKDFQYRFGRMPEGMWLAETAIDDDTIKVLADCGIKFTVLSPHQAQRVRPIGSDDHSWKDVGWGNIDPARAYRCYLKDGTDRYVDLFFYDGSISKSVAFDNLLKDGEKFIKRIQDGYSSARDYSQLVHLSTDGESYGHHTKFGDMALSYILQIKAEEVGFKITNYAEYLELNQPEYEVEVKEVSSWSCSHGVGRWKEDCGCETGGRPGWNQKWRKPLREALDWLRDELVEVYEEHTKKYLKDPWKARNKYIDVVLDRNSFSIKQFCKHEEAYELSKEEIVSVIKLLEMQRQAMLMYTSCGWFFNELSGIETVQILKYAAKAMQVASEFTGKNYEHDFLEILDRAQSNIKEYGTGKDIYTKFVKPSVIKTKQIVSHWAISSLFEEYEEETDVFCYTVKNVDYKKVQKGNSTLVVGRIEITSKVTTEKRDMIFAMLHFSGEDFHCAIKGFSSNTEYLTLKEEIFEQYGSSSLTEVIRTLDKYFGKEYFTLKDLFLEERRKIINVLIKDQMEKFSLAYQSLFEECKGPMLELQKLGLQIPFEFQIVSEYTISKEFNALFEDEIDLKDEEFITKAKNLNDEAKLLGVKPNKDNAVKIFSQMITENLKKFEKHLEIHDIKSVIAIIRLATELEVELNLKEAQNIYFSAIYKKLPALIKEIQESRNFEEDKKFGNSLLVLGEKLNIKVDNFKEQLNSITKTAVN